MAPEILAPAGSYETLTAAVRCGADAVYLGGKAFNARRSADNFSDDELEQAIDYCHKRLVKVYVTLNTLVFDREISSLAKEAEDICRAGADGLIIQDLATAKIIKEICPGIPMHASTQMSVQSIYGLEELEKLGFVRAVLPRELSESEIRHIRANTDMELEYFVHGALCMCISGQCLMSSVFGGRSGNRGLCAQPCRLPFGINAKGGNNLSLKDLSLIDRISALADAGINSLKIEGRMKRPEYVAAAVTACKNAVSGKKDPVITDALANVFSRSGFTDGYFTGNTGKNMFGIRTIDDVAASSESLGFLSRLYDGEKPLIGVKMDFTLSSGKPASLSVTGAGFTANAVSENPPEPSVNKELTAEEAKARLSKCGGTQFFAEEINCTAKKGLFLSASALNRLRRDALSSLENEAAKKEPYQINGYSHNISRHIAKSRKLYLRFLDADKIPGSLPAADRVIIPLDTPVETAAKLSAVTEVAAEIPVNVFSRGEHYIERLKALAGAGVKLAVADGIDGIGIAEKAGMPFAAGFGTNICNSVSLGYFEERGAVDCLLSCECDLQSISAAGGDVPRGVLVYGRIPLMVTRNCPVKNKLTCDECGRTGELVDRMGIHFPVRCKYGCSQILNSRPVCMTDRLNEIRSVDFDLLYFTVESPAECLDIIEKYRQGQAVDGEFTRGLYTRTVL
ncbi:MAG: U32 family peptidase [Clostridia bacterium]|nr:U32 family peptidase [Clostridia bacterium]